MNKLKQKLGRRKTENPRNSRDVGELRAMTMAFEQFLREELIDLLLLLFLMLIVQFEQEKATQFLIFDSSPTTFSILDSAQKNGTFG